MGESKLKTVTAFAKELGVHLCTVKRAVEILRHKFPELGTRRGKRLYLSPEEQELVIAFLREKGVLGTSHRGVGMKPGYASLSSAAKRLGVDRRTLRGWIERGYVRAVIEGTFVWVPEEEIERLLKTHTLEPLVPSSGAKNLHP